LDLPAGGDFEFGDLFFNQHGIVRTLRNQWVKSTASEISRLAVRNQQVVGSNPTGGSRKTSEFN
jgi:hypothetical protein